MTDAIKDMDRLAEGIREPAKEYVATLQSLMGEKLLAVTFYGAVTAGVFRPDVHAARNVAVLQSVELEALRKVSRQGLKFGKASIAAPLIMTPAYIRASLDTFPLELIEIHQQHATVLGEDQFNELTFTDDHVRHQCERELKVMLIRMRQGLLAAAGRDKFVSALIVDVGEELMRTLRGLLWLDGTKEAKPALEVIAAVEKLVDKPMAGVRAALDASRDHQWGEFKALYADLEALGSYADAW